MRVLGLAAAAALAVVAAPAHAADPVLVAVGDIACNPASPSYNGGAGTASECHARHTSNLVGPLNPLNVLALGDLQYEDGKRSRFDVSYADSWGRPAIKSITKPVPGNHEYGAGNTNNDNIHNDPTASGYFGYFADQLAAEGPDAGNPQKGWYSFDVPVGGTKWHVVALNSECASGLRVTVGWEGECDDGSDQVRWLRDDLEADRSDCTLAFWHHPRFSSGGQSSSSIVAPIWNALYDDWADVVLTGHAHNYERLAQAGVTGAREPGRGIRSWVVGTGGKNMLPMKPSPLPATDLRSNTTHGVLKLTLHGPSAVHPRGWYEWDFVDDGQSGPNPLGDSGSGGCIGPRARPAGRVRVAPNIDWVAPRLVRARLSRKRFRVGRGTLIRFSLSEKSTVRFQVDRKRRGRWRRVGGFKRKLRAGRRRLRFTGRIGRRKLQPGGYRLTITPTDAANNDGKVRRLSFQIQR